MSQYAKDLLERIVATFVVAFIGALVVAAPDGGVSIDAAQAAALAGVAAVASLIKGVAAKYLTSNPDTASLTV
jgi:drug/metabolite transporter (DMT)-like permease